MKRFCPLLVSAAMAVFVLSPVASQPQGFVPQSSALGPPQPSEPLPTLMLLTQKSVQADIKLTATQTKKLNAAVTKQISDMNSTFDLPANQQAQKMQEIMKAADKAIDDLLTADQKKRVKQISLQLQGSYAFADADVVKDLKLTEEQQAKIKTINEGIGKQTGELFQGKPLAPQVVQKKLAEIKKNATERAAKLLTSEQSSTWGDIIGASFRGDLRMMPPMGFGPSGLPPK